MECKEIIIVSGLPRSGTSMMMNMLKAGGFPILTDELRQADEDNPYGYYELEDVKRIKEDISWLPQATGKAVKMVSALLYDLPGEYEYKIIFMQRPMKEILASQRKMLERMGKKDIPPDEEIEYLYAKHLKEIMDWLEDQPNMKVLYMKYNDLIASPGKEINKIRDFLGHHMDADKMISVVDPSLYRNRSDDTAIAGAEESPSEGESLDDEERQKIEDRLRSLGYM